MNDHFTRVGVGRGQVVRLVLVAYGVLVAGAVVACGDDKGVTDAAEEDVPLDTTDTDSTLDGADEVADADSADGRCEAGETRCRQGVVATCRADGVRWAFSACPAGEVCVTDGCVANLPSVTIVTNTTMPDEGPSVAGFPAELLDAIAEAMCDEVPQCCDAYLAALTSGGNLASIVATKFWVRRLLKDLDRAGDFYYALLGPPTVTDATAIPAPNRCEPVFEEQLEACLGGSERLLRLPEWDQILSGLYPPSVQPTALQIPAWTEQGETTRDFDPLMDAVTKEASTDSAALLRWVDGVSGGSGQEPELNVTRAMPYPMNWLTYLHLAKGARPEGRPCANTAACGHPHYTCVDGFCTDPAAACRVQDVVFVDTFAVPAFPLWEPDVCTGGVGSGADDNVWTQWLRWGVGCDKGWICREGATCLNPCDVKDGYCQPVDLCFPDDLRDQLSDPLVDRMLWNYQSAVYAVHDRYAVDAVGRRMLVTSHAIMVNTAITDNTLHGSGPIEDATIAAAAGGGVAVTPCAPFVVESGLSSGSALIDCDYEAKYAALIEGIAARARSATCTPADVGLVERE